MQNKEVILKELYPKVNNIMDKNTNKFRQMVGTFLERRSKEIYDIAPCDRIVYGLQDIEDLYKAVPVNKSIITNAISKTYYYEIPKFNPRAAKNEETVLILNIVRYFHKKKMQKELELSSIYLAFSGSFYPSIHFGFFQVVQPSEYRHIMEFVVNHRLNQQFDLKREGSLFSAIRSKCLTWLDTYSDRFDSFDDEDIVYLIQQLHDRIKAFLKNIASEYYDAFESKNYLTFDSDNLSEDNYHLADSDSLKIERAVENTMTHLNSNSIDYKIIQMAADSNVKPTEVKDIMETILNNPDYLPLVKELVRLLITNYFSTVEKKDLNDIRFLSYSLQSKPNTKNVGELRVKEIVETFLDENSPAYRKRKSRLSTKNSYNRSILSYFTLTIYNANK